MSQGSHPKRLSMRVVTLGLGALVTVPLALTSPALSAGASPDENTDNLSIATVKNVNPDRIQELRDLGLDVINVSDGDADILVQSKAEGKLLAKAEPSARTVSAAKQLAQLDNQRKAEERLERAAKEDPTKASDLPTGRVSYRTVDQVEREMKQIARKFPKIVKLVKLSEESLLGRPIYGLEISRDVDVDSGKPVFFTSGAHHAREWPTVEFTLEFVWDVVNSDGQDAKITGLLDSSRMIVVPMVNPDGYAISRYRIHEMKRKNCRMAPGEEPTFDECADPDSASLGVDLNRNYGSFWGGPGSSSDPLAGNHHGEKPYSEPEIQAMSDLITSHQIMVAINNHTPDEKLLRAPSSPFEPVPAEEAMYNGLAQKLGEALDFPAGPWTEIYYDASGVAEQEALYTAGTFGFTPELMPGFEGLERFHPPYEYLDDQYNGTDFYEGSSVRDALLTGWSAATDSSLHSIITGSAPRGVELTTTKTLTVDSSPVPIPDLGDAVIPSTKTITTTMTVPRTGKFQWHVLPSNRPSQYFTGFVYENWTVSCADRRGNTYKEVEVNVRRGNTAAIDMSDCPRPRR